jgi:hypothetical protein
VAAVAGFLREHRDRVLRHPHRLLLANSLVESFLDERVACGRPVAAFNPAGTEAFGGPVAGRLAVQGIIFLFASPSPPTLRSRWERTPRMRPHLCKPHRCWPHRCWPHRCWLHRCWLHRCKTHRFIDEAAAVVARAERAVLVPWRAHILAVRQGPQAPPLSAARTPAAGMRGSPAGSPPPAGQRTAESYPQGDGPLPGRCLSPRAQEQLRHARDTRGHAPLKQHHF